jgi:hypothetical protein
MCVVLGGFIAGGVVLEKLMPQSALGAILFMLGIFLGMPVLAAEFQPANRAASKAKASEAMEPARPSEPVRPSERAVPTAARLDVTELSYRCEPAGESAGESARLQISGACQWVAERGLSSFN